MLIKLIFKRLSKTLFFIGILLTVYSSITAEEYQKEFHSSKYPVAVSFLIADLKYSEEYGVQLCEVQQGIISNYKGDRFLNNEIGRIAQSFHNQLKQWGLHSWTILSGVRDMEIRRLITEDCEGWTSISRVNELADDETLVSISENPIYDPHNISNYHGLLYVRPKKIKDTASFHQNYPGVIAVDEPTFKYWVDKYMMSRLFLNEPRLEKVKPKWNAYPKKYHSKLHMQIVEEIPSEVYVIKPKGAFRGRGVIIVSRADLQKTLKDIIDKPRTLRDHPDSSFRYWYRDHSENFLVEAFMPSDPIPVPLLDGNFYDPTMRIGFVLAYENNTITMHYVGAYWKIPMKSVSGEGTLNEIHKSYGQVPFFCDVDPEVLQKVESQLGEPMLVLFEKMLMQK